ncbi:MULTISPECIES: beta-lactamase family protein [Streptomyces]|uniref:beta-lactamase family protein n=1 Tax=Streptomyces TaxID=1883 RepID=UPI0021DF4B8D|nr:beta-lactamase family protein [Streptomyces venezuelae]
MWRGSSGTADLSKGRAAKAGDRFRAGSVTKSFTATLVLQPVAEGRRRNAPAARGSWAASPASPGARRGGAGEALLHGGLGPEGNANTCPADGPVLGHTGEVVGYQTFSFTSADRERQVTLSVNTGLTLSDAAAKAATKVLSTALCRAERAGRAVVRPWLGCLPVPVHPNGRTLGFSRGHPPGTPHCAPGARPRCGGGTWYLRTAGRPARASAFSNARRRSRRPRRHSTS